MFTNLRVKLLLPLLKLLCAREFNHFQKALLEPENSQNRCYQKIIHDLSKTSYGRTCGINGKESYQEFIHKVPIQTYEHFESLIQNQLLTKKSVITPHRIYHVEPTSGSSGRLKTIPYTAPHLASFSKMFRIWTYDVLSSGFKPKTGRVFISVSPLIQKQGFHDERDYLTEPLRTLLSPFLVLPKYENNPNDFQKNLAITLLKETNLEVISIWSPSYLLTLLAYIEEHKTKLAPFLSSRKQTLLQSDNIDWEGIWPELKFISCWDSGASKPLATKIQSIFPNVQIQGKGLLATEAAITVPIMSANGHLPLLNDVFMEFELEDGQIKQLHELSVGEEVKLIISQQGGLTRYRLNDVIKVESFYQKTPVIKFIGRANQTSDLVGEKLSLAFVNQTIFPLMTTNRFVLVPYQSAQSGYILICSEPNTALAESIEQALCQSYHYALARQLNQLAPLKTKQVSNLSSCLLEFYQSEGMRLGNIKDNLLICDLNQAARLLTFMGVQTDTDQAKPLSTVE